MNFVIIPALIGPPLGSTVGGVIVHWLSWRDIFFVNVPVGLAALWFGHRHMPDYRNDCGNFLSLRNVQRVDLVDTSVVGRESFFDQAK